jgi:ankyrin repeat protein
LFVGFNWNRKEVLANRDKFMQKDKNGLYGLHIAAKLGVELAVIKEIVEINPDALREKDKFGCLPIHYAANCRSTSLETLQYFVNQSPRSIRERDGMGLLPIHHLALHQTNVEIFRYIDGIFSDAVREKDKDGWIALHFAAKSNSSVEVLQFLVLRYAGGLRESTSFGSLPIHCAAHYNKNLGTLEYLVAQHPGGLLEKGANGMLPLHSAARNNPSLTILDYLIGKNPDGLTMGDKNGRVPLHHAVRNPNAGVIVRYLTELYPAMLRHRDTSGWTPLHSAARYASNPAVLRYLAEQYPAALQAPDEDGWLPLHHCARGNSAHMDVLKLLVDLYPDALTVKNADTYAHDLAPATSDARSYLTLFHVAMQLDGRSQPMDVLRLHMLGDVGSGKSMAAHWLKTLIPADSLNVDLFDETHDIAWRHGRTQGMELSHVTLRLSDRVTHYLIQDYSGASHHLAHHLHYLHAPDSCFVIVLPLFDRVKRLRNSLSHLSQRLLYWMRLLFSRARSSNGGAHVMLILNAFVSDVKVSTDELQDIKAKLLRTLRRNFTLRYTCRVDGGTSVVEEDDTVDTPGNKLVSFGGDEDTTRYSYNYYGNSSSFAPSTSPSPSSQTSMVTTEQQTVWLVGGDVFVCDLRSKFSLNRPASVLRHQAPLAISTKVFRQSRILTYCWEVINMIDFSAVMQAEDVMQMLASAVRSFFTKQSELDQLMVHNALRKGVCEEVEARLLQHLIAFMVRLERLRLLDVSSFFPDVESDRLVITDPTAVSRHIIGAIVQQVSLNMKRSVVELAQTPRELASWVRGMPPKTMSPAVSLEKLLTQMGFALPMVQRSQPLRTKPSHPRGRRKLSSNEVQSGEPFDDLADTSNDEHMGIHAGIPREESADEDDSLDEELTAACCKHDVSEYLLEMHDQLPLQSPTSGATTTKPNPFALKSAFLIDAQEVDNVSVSSSSISSSDSDSSDDDSSEDASTESDRSSNPDSSMSDDEENDNDLEKKPSDKKSDKKSKSKKREKERLKKEKKKAKKAKRRAKKKAKKEQKRKEKEARAQKRTAMMLQQQLLKQQQTATTASTVASAETPSRATDVFYYLHSLVSQSCMDSDAFVVAGLKPLSYSQRCVSRVFRLVSPRYVLSPGYLSSLTTFICAAVRNQAAVTFYRDGLRLLFRHEAQQEDGDWENGSGVRRFGDLTQILIVPHVVSTKSLSSSTTLALTPASFTHDQSAEISSLEINDGVGGKTSGKSGASAPTPVDNLILGFEVHVSSQVPVYRRDSKSSATESNGTHCNGQYVDVAWETMTLVRSLITAHGQTSGFAVATTSSASQGGSSAGEQQGHNIHDSGGYAVHGETCCLLFRGLAEFCVSPTAAIFRGTGTTEVEDSRELMSVTEAETMWFAAASTADVSAQLLELYLGTGLERIDNTVIRGYSDATPLVLGLSVTDSAASVSAAAAFKQLFAAATTSPTGSTSGGHSGITVQDLARMSLMSQMPLRTTQDSDDRDIDESSLEVTTLRDLTAIVLDLLRHRLWRDHHSHAQKSPHKSSHQHDSSGDSSPHHHPHHHGHSHDAAQHHKHLVSVSRDRVRAIVHEALLLRNVYLHLPLFTTRNVQDLPWIPCLTRCTPTNASPLGFSTTSGTGAHNARTATEESGELAADVVPCVSAYRLHFFCPVCLDRASSGFSSTANYIASGGGADAYPGYLLRVLSHSNTSGEIVPQWDEDVIAALDLSVHALESALRIQPRHAQTAEFGALMQDTLELLLSHVATTTADSSSSNTSAVLQRAQRLFRVQQGVFGSLKNVINRGARNGYLFAEDVYGSGAGSSNANSKAVLVDENKEHLLPSAESGGGLRMTAAMSAGLRKLLLAAGDEHVLHTGLRRVSDPIGNCVCVCAPLMKRKGFGVSALGKTIRNAVMGLMSESGNAGTIDEDDDGTGANNHSGNSGVGGTGRLYESYDPNNNSGKDDGSSPTASAQSSCAKEFLRRGTNSLIVRVKL